MIYVLGSLNTDLCMVCRRIPKAGETVAGESFFVSCGGKGANQATACAKLGGKVKLCGCVGNDAFGERLVKAVRENGVETYVQVREGVPTGTAVILLCENNNRILVEGGANKTLQKEDVDTFLENAEKGDIFLTQGEIPSEWVWYALKKARNKGMVTVWNIAPAGKEFLSCIPFADYILVNETEAEIMGGMKVLLSKGAKAVITTLGEEGYEIADARGKKKYPCPLVKVVDTTGAGDTFCGGLCVALSEGKDLEEGCRFAGVAASLACTKKGALQAVPSREETEKFLETY